MERNPGHIPDECIVLDESGNVTGYRRVHVRLFNGMSTVGREPQGWPAGGNGGCNWRISRTPHDFEIEGWELA